MATSKKNTKSKQSTKVTLNARPFLREKRYRLCNTSSSDYELIVADKGRIQHIWMTPNKSIDVSHTPLTPQVLEFQRRLMLSVTEVHI
jgi:hypothetical protein